VEALMKHEGLPVIRFGRCYIVVRLEEAEKGEVFVKQGGKGFHESSSRLEKGSGDRNRTCDTGLMSPLLYRLSYAALH
jgi:hypothetical protein